MGRRTRRGFGIGIVAAMALVSAGFVAGDPLRGGAVAEAQTNEAGIGDNTEPRLLLNNEHVDVLVPAYDNGELLLLSQVDLLSGRGQLFDPADLVYQLKDSPDSTLPIPDHPAFSFLGAPGDPVWIAPMIQNPGLIWAGWNTENPSLLGVFDPQDVDVHLLAVDGPGPVEV